MDYEIVSLAEKTVMGLMVRTSNTDPMMREKIGGLWKRFFEEDIFASVSGRGSVNPLGVYSDYESDASGEYDLTVCCEKDRRSTAQLPDLRTLTIPAGSYARFRIDGQSPAEVAEAWREVWGKNLNRAYRYDFEEYHGTGENATVDLYISVVEGSAPEYGQAGL